MASLWLFNRKKYFKFVASICFFGVAVATVQAPGTGTDLLCHTSNPDDCYPRIFQPTEDFQIVREDQDLPAGLHVRLNIYTGLKEARLNTPMAYEEAESEQAVVLVSETADDAPIDNSSPPDPSRKLPLYETAGKILPPRDGQLSGDTEDFYRAVDILSVNTLKNDAEIGLALADLSELSHDIFYGVELMKQREVVQQLVSLMTDVASVEALAIERRREAASILANSVQNNPTALKEFQNSWKEAVQSECEGIESSTRRQDCEDERLVKIIVRALEMEREPSAMRAKIGMLSGLSKNKGIRHNFIAGNGMEILLSIFVLEGEKWDGTRMKTARFIMDTFLDKSMNADLGVWPTHAAADSKFCSHKETAANDECWEYHLEKMRDESGSHNDESWITNFLKLLKESPGRKQVVHDSKFDREL